MADMGFAKVAWSGTSGGPGVSTFAFRASSGSAPSVTNANNMLARLRTWFDAMKAGIPNEVTFNFEPEVIVLDVVTGALSSVVVASSVPASVTGTASTGYASGVGWRIDWLTGAILRGRRVQGRTYIVPGAAAAFDTDGSLTAAHVTAHQGYANTYLAGLTTDGLTPHVYCRPNEAKGYIGNAYPITSGVVFDKSAVLRTRRD